VIGRSPPWWRRAADRLAGFWRHASGRVRRRAVLARMRPADVVLASPRTRGLSLTALSYRLLLGSRYVHTMLYLGDGEILHTTAREGVTIDRAPGKIFDQERYRVLRVPGLDDARRRRVVAAARRLLDHGLDHLALVTNIPSRWFGLPHPLLRAEKNRVWCSKLVHEAFREAGVELLPDGPEGTVTSEDLARSPVLEEV
jgi:hypothetical protein